MNRASARAQRRQQLRQIFTCEPFSDNSYILHVPFPMHVRPPSVEYLSKNAWYHPTEQEVIARQHCVVGMRSLESGIHHECATHIHTYIPGEPACRTPYRPAKPTIHRRTCSLPESNAIVKPTTHAYRWAYASTEIRHSPQSATSHAILSQTIRRSCTRSASTYTVVDHIHTYIRETTATMYVPAVRTHPDVVFAPQFRHCDDQQRPTPSESHGRQRGRCVQQLSDTTHHRHISQQDRSWTDRC